MATVPRTTTPVQHYAYLGDRYGTAELLNGWAISSALRAHARPTLVSYKDPG